MAESTREEVTKLGLYDLVTVILRTHGLDYLSSVGGGGVNQVLGHLAEDGVTVSNASSELSGISRSVGFQRLLKPGLAGAYSTHGVGIAQYAGVQDYHDVEARIPMVSILGANVNGQTGPMHFQRFKPDEMLAPRHRLFEIRIENGKPQINDLATALMDFLDDGYVHHRSMSISVPTGAADIQVGLTAAERDRIINPNDILPVQLHDGNRADLDKVVERVNAEGSKTLIIPGEGLLHCMRMFGKEQVFNTYLEAAEKIVCNRMTTLDNADMLTGHEHDLTASSHNFDPKVFDAIKKNNTVICLGSGPNATVTGIGGVSTSFFQNTNLIIIDSDPKLLEEWKKDYPKATIIQADPYVAAHYLAQQEYQNTQSRAILAKENAQNLRRALDEEAIQVPGATMMRDVYAGVAAELAKHANVGISICSGDTANQFLRFRTRFDGPGTLFYPTQGMLGVATGATYGFAHGGDFEKVVLMIGDGGAGYSTGELPELAKLAKDRQMPIVAIMVNNQFFGSVDKGIYVGANAKETDSIKARMHAQNEKASISFAGLAHSMPEYDVKGVCIDGATNPHEVASALAQALEHKGLTILEVDARKMALSPRPGR